MVCFLENSHLLNASVDILFVMAKQQMPSELIEQYMIVSDNTIEIQ